MKCDAQPSSECACKANAVHGSAGQCRVAKRSTRVSQNLPDSLMPVVWSGHLGSDKHSAPRRFPIVFVLRCPITIESLEFVDLLLASKASSLMCSTPRLIPVYRAGIRTLWSLALVAVGDRATSESEDQGRHSSLLFPTHLSFSSVFCSSPVMTRVAIMTYRCQRSRHRRRAHKSFRPEALRSAATQ
jgi:hypothetical protein